MTIETAKLDNGLTIIASHMPHLKTVAINTMIKVGSKDEDENNSGISHLIEHMAFKGTEKRNTQSIAEEFDSIGGYNNAYTSRENTSFHCKVIKDDWKKALDIISDISINSIYPGEELEREKAVVCQEILENNDSPDDVVFDIFHDSAFPNQPMGRSILGNAESVNSITREQIMNFTNQHYQPSNMVLSVAGDININEIVDQAGKLFKFNQRPYLPNAKIAHYEGGVAINKNEFEQVHLVIGFEGLSYTDENYYDQYVLSNLLGGNMSSRLFQEIREKRGLAYSIGTSVSSYDETGTFTINAGTSEDKFREVIDVSIAELSKVMEGVSEEEIIRSKKQIVAGLLMASENNNYCADEAAKSILTHGRYISNEEVFQKINAVGSQNIIKLAKRIFNSKITFAATGKVDSSMGHRFNQTILA